MNKTLKRQFLKTFTQLLLDYKNQKELETFLNDFFTEGELDIYLKRIMAAYYLKKGRDSRNIKINLETTDKEIAEAKKILETSGIKLAIKKIEADEWANVWSEKIKKIVKA